MDIEEARDELLAAVDRAKYLWQNHRLTSTLPVTDDPECPCTIQYHNPENVHMIIAFTCPRHAEASKRIYEHLQGETHE
jgi:hypothetical protein